MKTNPNENSFNSASAEKIIVIAKSVYLNNWYCVPAGSKSGLSNAKCTLEMIMNSIIIYSNIGLLIIFLSLLFTDFKNFLNLL